MAGIKISALPGIPSTALTDIYPTVQGGVTYKATLTQLLTLFNANIQIAESQVTNLTTDLAGKLALAGGTMLGTLTLNTSSPTLPLQAASKGYVDSVAQGITVQGACRLGTTGALTATYANGTAGVGATLTNATTQAALTLDGVLTVVGDRVLIKNQGAAAQNGIYTVSVVGTGATNWVLTRATDYDQAAEINPGDLVIITAGNTLASSSWIETATVVTVGTDAINFSQFSASLPISLSNGGTSASLTASNGGIFYSTASAGAILSGTATAQQLLLSGASTTPQWSTTTYPLTNAINTIMYASSANVQGVITAANNGVMVTGNTGIPSWNTSPGQGLSIASSVLTVGVGNNIPFNDDKGLQDANGNLILTVTKTATAVNYMQILNNAAGSPPALAAQGSDTNIELQVGGKGTGGVKIVGCSTNSSAVSGVVGEIISSVIASGSAVTMTSNTATDLTSISLTAGDWDVWGGISFPSVGSVPVGVISWISLTSATLPDQSLRFSTSLVGATIAANSGCLANPIRVSIASTTTVYISGYLQNTSGNGTGCGGIYARRRR